MLIGGFIDGKLFHIFKFKFNSEHFTRRIEQQLIRRFPNGDKTGEYLRSASFTLSAYEQSDDLDMKILVSKSKLQKNK